MKHRIAINLFGQFEVRFDAVPVRMPTRKVELILALLAIEPDVALSRSTLAGMLWPGQPDAQARASLRQAIFRLKTALEPSAALEVTSGWIKLRSDRITRDIDALDHTAAASALPIGTPLEGMSGYEAEIEDRLDAARAGLRARLMHWLGEAQAKALAARRFTDLESFARRHLVLDGYDESALRMLMTALWRQGRRNAALDLFRDVSQRIRAELSVSVDPATTSLYQEIRAQPAAPPDSGEIAATPATIEAPAELVEPSEEPVLPHLRHVAVMHVISNRLLAALQNRDPEDAEAASRAACDAIERVLRREGGIIAGQAGHRLSCVFGADRPDESPALSAALAAFEIARLDCAVGIDAARGLVGGETGSFPATHLAQVLAEAAVSGAVYLTGAVADACRGAFVLEAVGPVGERSAAAWRLTGEVLSRGGFDIRKARGLTPFVARQAEIDTVLSLADAKGSRAVAVTGEAGIGKSRLVHECLGRLRPSHLLRVQFLPNEAGGGIARFAPILASLLPQDVASDPIRALDAAVPDKALRRRIAPAESLLAERGSTSSDADASRGVRMQALADALLVAIQVLASRNAVLLIEDAHWCDEDGALLLERMLRSLDGDGPLVIVTFRPGGNADLSSISGLRTLALAPLSEAQSIRILTMLGHENPGGIAARTGGVPLFIEEIARAAEIIDPPGSRHSIPDTLARFLTRRIDALPAHLRRTIEAAAVLGAEPADDLLLPLSGLRADAYEAAIAQLADGDLLFRVRSLPQRVYGFKHALVQEAAYEAIPTRRRVDLHAGVVSLREADWRAGDRSLSAMLADHAAKAGMPRLSVESALAATEDAVSSMNYALARRTLEIAQKSLQQLDPDQDTKRLRLQLLQLRLPILTAGADIRELQTNVSEALKLSEDLGDDRLYPHLSVHAAFIYQHYDPVRALEHADNALRNGSALSDPVFMRESVIARCQILSLQGKMKLAMDAIEPYAQEWENDWSERDEYLVSRYVMNQFLITRSTAALGNSPQALSHVWQAIRSAVHNDHPIDRYIARLAVGDLANCAHRWTMAANAYRKAADIARDQEHTFFWNYAEGQRGIAELRTAADAERGRKRLQALIELGDDGLHPVSRIEAEAALLCHDLGGVAGRDIVRTESVLGCVRRLELPAVELRLLETLARCETSGAQDWSAVASAIRAEQGYAPCDLSNAEATALMEALA